MRNFPNFVMEAAFAFVLADKDRMRNIARSCDARTEDVTGPSLEMVAALIARGDDPSENIGLIVDACRRELMPRGPLIDPADIKIDAEPIRDYLSPMDPDRSEPDYLPDERHSPRTGRRHAQKRRTAREFGQFGFAGLYFHEDIARDLLRLHARRPRLSGRAAMGDTTAPARTTP